MCVRNNLGQTMGTRDSRVTHYHLSHIVHDRPE